MGEKTKREGEKRIGERQMEIRKKMHVGFTSIFLEKR